MNQTPTSAPNPNNAPLSVAEQRRQIGMTVSDRIDESFVKYAGSVVTEEAGTGTASVLRLKMPFREDVAVITLTQTQVGDGGRFTTTGFESRAGWGNYWGGVIVILTEKCG